MKFLIYRDNGGEWRWTLLAKNGKKIADSAEGYKRKGRCLRMVTRIIMNASEAEIEYGSYYGK